MAFKKNLQLADISGSFLAFPDIVYKASRPKWFMDERVVDLFYFYDRWSIYSQQFNCYTVSQGCSPRDRGLGLKSTKDDFCRS